MAVRHKPLKNKPLVEAILEIHWVLQTKSPGVEIDPHFKILLGRLFDKLSSDYPEHEPLPISTFPEEMSGGVVHHRFRVGADQWPLVQIGPGIITYNSTQDYTWDGFKPRALSVVEKLFAAYPKRAELNVRKLVLRYIDAVEFDYGSKNVLEFLRDKMKLQFTLPPSLFAGHQVDESPQGFSWQTAFQSTDPNGKLILRFATGQRESKPALVWETTFESSGNEIQKMPEDFEAWLDGAHQVVNDCFFKLIEGDLEREFTCE